MGKQGTEGCSGHHAGGAIPHPKHTLHVPCMLCLHSRAVGPGVGQRGWTSTGTGQ